MLATKLLKKIQVIFQQRKTQIPKLPILKCRCIYCKDYKLVINSTDNVLNLHKSSINNKRQQEIMLTAYIFAQYAYSDLSSVELNGC
jgi:hypothetical protein